MGVLHIIIAHNFKNYINITSIDEKLNFCDFFDDLTKKHCPIQPGKYHLQYNAQVPRPFWLISVMQSFTA